MYDYYGRYNEGLYVATAIGVIAAIILQFFPPCKLILFYNLINSTLFSFHRDRKDGSEIGKANNGTNRRVNK